MIEPGDLVEVKMWEGPHPSADGVGRFAFGIVIKVDTKNTVVVCFQGDIPSPVEHTISSWLARYMLRVLIKRYHILVGMSIDELALQMRSTDGT